MLSGIEWGHACALLGPGDLGWALQRYPPTLLLASGSDLVAVRAQGQYILYFICPPPSDLRGACTFFSLNSPFLLLLANSDIVMQKATAINVTFFGVCEFEI
jgi:hypothetical protein